MAATVRTGAKEDPVGGTPFDLSTARAGTAKRRVPEILVGTFLVSLFALAGAWFYSTSTESTAYVALREDVTRGQVIAEQQLTTYELNTEAPIRGVGAAEATSIVGQVALADLRAGTLITRDQFAEKAQIAAGFGVVGLDLSPGEFPTSSLRPGDRVRVVILPRRGDVVDQAAVAVVDTNAEVVEVVGGSGSDRFISLTMRAELADQVAAADAEDRIRLIQVPEG